jgi:hypothetical protein
MQTQTPILPPPPSIPATDAANVRIGIVLFLHPCCMAHECARQAIALIGVSAPFFMLQASQALKLVLLRSGVTCENVLPLGTGCDGSICFETGGASREAAIEIAGAFCDACLWFDRFATIAWLDSSEGAWRAVRNSTAPIRLENYFTADTDKLRAEELERTMRALESLQDAFSNLLPSDQPQ